MGNARLKQSGGDGQLSGLNHVVSGGEHRIHLAHQRADSGNDLVGGVAGLLNIGDVLAVQIGLGILNGRGTVEFRSGVQETHGLDIGVLSQHHVQDELHVQGVAGAGDIGDSGELGYLGVADGTVDHRGLGLLGGDGHLLGRQGADRNDGIIAVGNNFRTNLEQGGCIVVAAEVPIFNAHAQLIRLGVQFSGDGVPDLVHRGVIQLADHGNLIPLAAGGVGGAAAGLPGGSSSRGGGAAGGISRAGTGGQSQSHGKGQGQRGELLHNVVLFHKKYLHCFGPWAEICLGG